MLSNSWLRTHHIMRKSHATCIVCAAAAAALAAITLAAPSASAAYINVYGGPTYTPGVGGFKGESLTGVNDAGAAVGSTVKCDDAGANKGGRAVRWDGSGTTATELGTLGTNASGFTESFAEAINDAGAVVGSASKVGSGMYLGQRAVRWDASGTAATELGNLGTAASGYTDSAAVAINDAGTAVGWAFKFGISGEDMGERAVRWDDSGTAATELENLGTDAIGGTGSYAYAINDAGAVVGSAAKYDDASVSRGQRAVRWDASGTAATELENLGTDAIGYAESIAYAINDAGTAVGHADMYDELGVSFGQRAVRWDASGTVVTELGNLGTDNNDVTQSRAVAINDAGTAVGHAAKYDDSGTSLGFIAVYWGLDSVAVDLNTLIDPASGWTLNNTWAISNTGWIAGNGAFDPDGPGGQDAYARLFLMHVPATAVPEPATLVVLFGVGLVGLGAASRRRVRRSVATAESQEKQSGR